MKIAVLPSKYQPLPLTSCSSAFVLVSPVDKTYWGAESQLTPTFRHRAHSTPHSLPQAPYQSSDSVAASLLIIPYGVRFPSLHCVQWDFQAKCALVVSWWALVMSVWCYEDVSHLPRLAVVSGLITSSLGDVFPSPVCAVTALLLLAHYGILAFL